MVTRPFHLQRAWPYLLISAGLLPTLQGARELLESQLGQYEAAHEFAAQPQPSRRPAPPEPGDTIAKLTIPRLNTELYVVEGTEVADLRRGPGHLSGTAMPGHTGNCVIAGHRDTHFRVLRQIHSGDAVILETPKGRFVYRVNRTQVVSPDDTSALQPAASVLHLITCYPFYYVGAAPKRLVVEARLVHSEAGSRSAESTF